MPCPDAETLASMAEDRLSGAERVAIANHAASCRSCRGVLSALMGWEPASAAPLTAGAHVDRYVIEERLGAGGMGVVYAARDPELGRRVALKLVRSGDDDERLRREAQALARLSHPNVVAVHDVGTHGEQLFIAMALVDGADLRRWLRMPRTVPEILRHLVAAGRGLAAAHAAGLVHRDLKPDNIFISEGGQALVGDFGLARTLDDAAHPPSASGDAPALTPLTVTGMVLGTPAYMAPEQRDGEATAASDQFGFCVTAWEALFGERPFGGDTLAAIERAIRAGDLTPPRTDRGVPARVQRALRRGLAPDPAARWPSMDALLDELTPRAARWPWIAGGVGVVGAAAAAAALLAMPAGDRERARLPDGCRGDGTLAAHWNPARRSSLAATLTSRDTAPATGETPRVLALVDRYATDWNAMRTEICTTAAPQRPDLVASRLACLDQRALELDAALDVVTSTEAMGPASSWDAIDGLRAVDRCRHARDVAPPPQSPALDEARTALAAVAARSDDRWNDLVAVRTRIEPLGDPALLLDALLLEASVALLRSNPAAAETAARRALEVAERLGADLDKAHAGALLVEALVRLKRTTEAQGQLPQAIAALQRGGGDRDVGLAVDTARASVARGAKDLPGEIAIRRAILDAQQRHRDPRSRRVLDAAADLADAYQLNQQPELAAELFELVERSFPSTAGGDPRVALRNAIASATIDGQQALVSGEYARAVEQTRIAVALHERLAPGGREHAIQVFDLAVVHELAGEWSDAHAAYADAARRFRAAPAGAGPDDDLRESLEGVGRNALELGDAGGAIDPAREALAMARAADDREHVQTATLVLARALLAVDRPAEAVALLDPLVRELDQAADAPASRRGSASFLLAQGLWATGGARERDRARALVGDAITALDAAHTQYAANPAYATALRLIDARLAAARDWQARHP